jgi:hypothetical protein
MHALSGHRKRPHGNCARPPSSRAISNVNPACASTFSNPRQEANCALSPETWTAVSCPSNMVLGALLGPLDQRKTLRTTSHAVQSKLLSMARGFSCGASAGRWEGSEPSGPIQRHTPSLGDPEARHLNEVAVGQEGLDGRGRKPRSTSPAMALYVKPCVNRSASVAPSGELASTSRARRHSSDWSSILQDSAVGIGCESAASAGLIQTLAEWPILNFAVAGFAQRVV